MSVKYRLYRNNISNTGTHRKWYARAVVSRTVGIDEIAARIQDGCTVKRSDVLAVLCELSEAVRDELLDIFLEFIQDEGRSILVSSHILSDLEKVCDYVTFIHGGRLLFSEEKDTLLEKYVVAKLSEAELRSLDPAKVAGLRRSAFGVEALVERSAARGLVCDPAGIEDIMLYYLRGETK